MGELSLKEQGDTEFKAKNYAKAIEFYAQALVNAPNEHTIYGNRSNAYLKLKNYEDALADANKCIELKADWSKGYHRKGTALH